MAHLEGDRTVSDEESRRNAMEGKLGAKHLDRNPHQRPAALSPRETTRRRPNRARRVFECGERVFIADVVLAETVWTLARSQRYRATRVRPDRMLRPKRRQPTVDELSAYCTFDNVVLQFPRYRTSLSVCPEYRCSGNMAGSFTSRRMICEVRSAAPTSVQGEYKDGYDDISEE